MKIKQFFKLKNTLDNNTSIAIGDNLHISSETYGNEIQQGENIDIDFVLNPTDDMARDLMMLVGEAIDCWAKMYKIEDLPKHLIFKQALGVMNAWNNISVSKDNL